MGKIQQTKEHRFDVKNTIWKHQTKTYLSTTHLYRMENNVKRNCIEK